MTSPNSNSTPPRASFASALAQKQQPTASKPESPSKAASTPAVVVVTAAADQSPIVKLPAQPETAQPTASVKIAPIKFGSFAAAAAAAASTTQSGPTLPPRTQSAPPSVVEVAVAAKESVAVASNLEEPTVVLPAIQEDSHSQSHVSQVSFNYEQPQPSHQQHQQHYQQLQQQQQYHHQQQQQHYQQQQYQPRPRYNQQQSHQQQQPQRYYNPQQQQHQHQHQHQYYNNQSYRPNYRLRPQYQSGEGYYHPGMVSQGNYYPHMSNGPAAGVAFQRPAPAFNNYVRPAVAPAVPANMPGFVASVDSVAPVTAAPVPVFVKPVPSKIKIVDPKTGKEISFGSKTETKTVEPEVVAETVESEVVVKIVEPVSVKPLEPVVTKSVDPVVTAFQLPVTPVKKISIVIKDPSSKQELDLSQVVARPISKEDLAVEELTAAFSSSTKLDEGVTCESPLPVSNSPIPTTDFEHDKSILANLNVDDDDVSEDEDDDDYSDYSSDEDEEVVFIPSTVQFNQSISYPEGFIPFKAPADDTGVWLYSREFMLQFKDKCTTTPGDLQERLSAAVEKAKAFASSERINGDDRSQRRDGQRDDRKKRRNNNGGGPLGPQAHLLDMNAVLKNRAENAWAPVRSDEEISQVDRILREVKGLLNKLTLEKFHVISDKILSLGIMSPDVLSGVIDCVFDKSVMEPRFAPMYAELCYKIVVEELNGLKKSLPAIASPDSQFRRLLVERCQAEYKHKRAWSKKRLEKLLSTETDETVSVTVTVVSESVEATPKTTSNVGELTEEDYLLIKLKRRVLGNMRFIGEIFKVGLIGEKIMHSIITELLSNVENPEEEEIECLCRLLMTVGAILDKPEAANFWNQYIGRMNWLISQSDKLSSRVRFMVMDVLECRDKKWKTGKADEGPKTIAQIQMEQQNKERNDRDRERDRADRDRADRDRERDRVDRDRHERERNKQGGPALKFTSGKQQQQQPSHPHPHHHQPQQQEWNRSGPAKPAQSNRNSSVRRPVTPHASPIVASSTETSVGRFGVLNMEDDHEEPITSVTTTATYTAAISNVVTSNVATSSVSDEERSKKIVSLLDELVQMNNYPDIYEELKLCGTKSAALSGLLNRAVEGGKKPALSAVIRIFSECPEIARIDQLAACKQSFGMIDDLAVDVPSVYETAGQLYAALSLSLPEIFETLSECTDDSAKTRVILQTIANAPSSNQEFRDALRADAKEFVEKNKKPGIENLMKKLNIEF